jgi:hypothetical protein
MQQSRRCIVLGRFLTDKAPHVRLVVHRDRDYMSHEASSRFEDRLNENTISSLLTDGNDIESYFISAQHLHALNPTVSAARIQELIEQATTETQSRSLTAVVNLRTEEAFRKRQAGAPPPNHGEIAVTAQTDYAADPATYRRGKLVLGRLMALLQQEIGQNPRVFLPSPHLASPRITEIALSIWPPAG